MAPGLTPPRRPASELDVKKNRSLTGRARTGQVASRLFYMSFAIPIEVKIVFPHSQLLTLAVVRSKNHGVGVLGEKMESPRFFLFTRIGRKKRKSKKKPNRISNIDFLSPSQLELSS